MDTKWGSKYWYKRERKSRGREAPEGGKILKKGEREGYDAPRTQSEDLNPPNCIDVRLTYSGQAYLRMSFHKHHDQTAYL